jgi:hypothetical protein
MAAAIFAAVTSISEILFGEDIGAIFNIVINVFNKRMRLMEYRGQTTF